MSGNRVPNVGMDSLNETVPSSGPMDVKVSNMPSQERREQLRNWLDAGLREKGKKATDLAVALGITPSRVTEMRQGKRGIKAEELATIAQFLGTEPPQSNGEPANQSLLPLKKHPLTMLKIVGVAEAGAFRQQDMLTQVPETYLQVPPSEAYPSATHYALLVRGDSMDKRGIFDGDHVSVVDYAEIGAPLKNGTLVHVQRSADGGYIEWTVKEVHAFPDRYELWPQSTNPSHKPYTIPRSNYGAYDPEITILGIVVGVHRKLTF